MTKEIFLLYLFYLVVFAKASVEVESAYVPEMNNQNDDKNISLPECTFNVTNSSIEYFRSKLAVFESEFIRFRIRLINSTVVTKILPGVFQPDLWVWTYRPPHGNYSYLSWNLQYGLLSFSILETQLYVIRHIDLLTTQSECLVTFGETETTSSISHSLMKMVDVSEHNVPKYQHNYICYLSEVPGIKNSFAYKAGLYLSFPVTFINYKCCTYGYSFQKVQFVKSNCNMFFEKWQLLTYGPYFLGVTLLLIFPILLFAMCACISKCDQILPMNVEMGQFILRDTIEQNWVYLDGNSPVTVFHVLSQPLNCFRRKHPILDSRLRCLICVCFAPMFIYLQLYMFKDGYVLSYHEPVTRISVRDLVKFGKPVGFLALYGDMSDMNKAFVPILGGPFGVIILYFSLALILIVCPKSLKKIVNNGLPRQSDVSALFHGLEEIPMSEACYCDQEKVYERASEICKQRVYLLFSTDQWRKVFSIQRKRFESHPICRGLMRTIMETLTFPFKAMLCVFEVFIYILFFLFPVFTFSVIILKGAVVSIMYTRNSFKRRGSIVSNHVIWFFITVFILGAVFVFGYCVCLVFLESFIYLAQMAIYCFVALILFPTIAFGYLFFFVTLMYYLAHLVGDFGDGYSRLLQIVVNKSIVLEQAVNVVIYNDKTLEIINVNQHFETVKLNGEEIAIPIETQINIQSRVSHVQMVMHKHFAPGIPRELFDKIVKEKRPVNAQIVHLLVHLTIIMSL
ncbi:uncharacterized protein LOC128213227 [Mya arenaria]|uniref:uncharacterized protein LOC128213227 n=1 Tax=Mya arenaria TaxID=6604 RepID=UPI0022E3EC35|nr:uncharacterized protein LOC128213227 [Mya arenaria]